VGDSGARREELEDRVVDGVDPGARGDQSSVPRSPPARKGLHGRIVARLSCVRMPDATVLYVVSAVVVAALAAWVAVVLKTAKEPWARPEPAGATAEKRESESKDDKPPPPSAADATAEATAVVIGKKEDDEKGPDAKAATAGAEEPTEKAEKA
jgi:hypothetical protein